MKSLALTVCLASACTCLFAQECTGVLYVTPNAKLRLTLYDKKGKETGVQTVDVMAVVYNNGRYESTVNTTTSDEKGRVLASGTGGYRCSDSVLSADMRMFLPREGLGNMKMAEAKIDSVYLEYPAAPEVGQKLADAEMKMDMTTNGLQTSMTFREEGRTVTAKETVTSPAGTWDAYVIRYDGSLKTRVAGIGMPGFSFTGKEWFVPGTGLVKTETYAKSGKLVGSALLTSVTQ